MVQHLCIPCLICLYVFVCFSTCLSLCLCVLHLSGCVWIHLLEPREGEDEEDEEVEEDEEEEEDAEDEEDEEGQEQKRHVELGGGGGRVGLKEEEGNAMFGSKA